jgi:hypothetical protein
MTRSLRRTENDPLSQILSTKAAPTESEVSELTKTIQALQTRVINLEQQAATSARENATARHLCAMFEEYVQASTGEAAAMLASHNTLKQQVLGSETMVSALAEKLVTMVGTAVNKVREFEETQVGHHNKILEVDTRAKDLLHK